MKLPLNKFTTGTKSFLGALMFIGAFAVISMIADIDPNINSITITYVGVE